jgi:hypothetical protein
MTVPDEELDQHGIGLNVEMALPSRKRKKNIGDTLTFTLEPCMTLSYENLRGRMIKQYLLQGVNRSFVLFPLRSGSLQLKKKV